MSAGVANFTTAALTLGTHSFTAVYTGDADFTGSTSSPSQQFVGATNTALASSPNPSNFGQSVTFTATVTADAGGAYQLERSSSWTSGRIWAIPP